MRTFVSVDCVIFGFDGSRLNVLLVQRQSEQYPNSGLKLPGSLIYQEEDADIAAHRVLYELTGIRKMALKQFKSFTSPRRTANPDDLKWLEYAYGNKIDRLITISYLSLCKINRRLNVISKYKTVEWCPVNRLPDMPFDHNQIVAESMEEIKQWLNDDQMVVFELLPSKFTATALRNLYEAIRQKQCDARNFHKKMINMFCVIPLDEKQANVPHRAGRLYKFDKNLYKKRMSI
ncbi:MAG: NUDIX hydrolase [Bacteroidales bacterium]|jgi:ADP-ribose pyrophosphatase YjhB (NUDIX family)|nr:NUDIX hydrolase [Bacteroidales bacterium]